MDLGCVLGVLGMHFKCVGEVYDDHPMVLSWPMEKVLHDQVCLGCSGRLEVRSGYGQNTFLHSPLLPQLEAMNTTVAAKAVVAAEAPCIGETLANQN